MKPFVSVAMAIIIVVGLWFLVVAPANRCVQAGGEPVAGIVRIVCVQPFRKEVRP